VLAAAARKLHTQTLARTRTVRDSMARVGLSGGTVSDD